MRTNAHLYTGGISLSKTIENEKWVRVVALQSLVQLNEIDIEFQRFVCGID